MDFSADDDVLEDLVQGVAGVELAVCVWRSIVKDKLARGIAIGGLPCVQVIGASLDILVPLLVLGRAVSAKRGVAMRPRVSFSFLTKAEKIKSKFEERKISLETVLGQP